MGFVLKEKDGVRFLQISAFEETELVNHGFSTRLGGVSRGHLSSLNLGIKKNDETKAVLENFSRFCKPLEIDLPNLVFSDQVHGTSIYVASDQDKGKGILRDTDIWEKDALITRSPKVALVTFFADCVPLFFLDCRTQAIGVAHAGWRGTLKQIGPKVVEKMQEEFGSSPEDILVGIGPCIHQCCYEVDEPVVKEFGQAFEYSEDLLKPSRKGHWYLDLPLANQRQLKDIGILAEKIYTCNLCTSCNNSLFFSHRADSGKTGSLAAIIELR